MGKSFDCRLAMAVNLALIAPGLAAAQPAPPKTDAAAEAQELARQLLGQVAARFREADVTVPQPISVGEQVEFYATPFAAYDGVCMVDVVSIFAEFNVGPDVHTDTPLKARDVRAERRLKLIETPPPDPKAADERCRNLPTAKDFFRIDGPEALARGAEPFRQAVIQARSANLLTFDLRCEDFSGRKSGGDCADRGRKALARMDVGKISAVAPCREPQPGRPCYTVTYNAPKFLNGQQGWAADVISDAAGKPQAVLLRQVRYPVS